VGSAINMAYYDDYGYGVSDGNGVGITGNGSDGARKRVA
jgi:hypothetical protein